MEKVKKIWSIVSTVLVAIVVIAAVFLLGSRLMGYRVFNIVSGSMAPEYNIGDLIYVQEVDPATVKVNDVITFILNEDLVIATHRVVRIDAEKQHFYTKGDVNDTEDANPVHFKNLVGIPTFKIPKLGYVSDFVQNPPGMYITIAAVAILIILAFAPDFVKKPTVPEPAEAGEKVLSAEEQAAIDENTRLKEELEKLKAQLAQEQEAE